MARSSPRSLPHFVPLSPRPGDTLCVWKLDRLGRSVKDVLTIADDLHERG
jgi:DNA invertase Pin-like site-specific DNA recombinase